MTTKDSVRIAPADGKLGVLLPGIGAVSTTFIAGVEAVKRGLGAPIGSLTQLATVRLGKRTEGRTPLIKDFVPLAKLEDLEFGGWDIFEDSAYEAARNAAVLDPALLEQVREPLEKIRPMEAVFDQDYVRNIRGPNLKEARTKMDKAAMLMDDIRQFQHRTGVTRTVMVWCGSTEVFHRPSAVHETLKALRGRAGQQRSRNRAEPDLRLRRAQDGYPVRQRRAQPDHRHARACWSSRARPGSPSAARTSRPARR